MQHGYILKELKREERELNLNRKEGRWCGID